MAAIAGVVPRLRGCQRDAITRIAIAMRDSMARRAPIEGGLAVAYDGSVALAHRGGDGPGGECVLQPLRNESGTLWLVADGEPTNAAELRLELIGDGHCFQSGSGSEVILHLYEHHGVAGLERLAGSFAFALWDREHHELILGRDRFGEKPLYIADASDRFAFASEAQALAPEGDLDVAALVAFLRLGYLPDPRTMYRDVRAVPPGSIVRVRGERVTVRSFWGERSDASVDGAGDAAGARLGYLLRAAVEGAVDRDEHAGLYLDGALETAALLALTRPVLGAGVRAHELGFEGTVGRAGMLPRSSRSRARPDTQEARALASWFHCEHRDHRVGPNELAAAFDAGAEDDEPSMGSAIAHLRAALLRAAGERVWLSALSPPDLFTRRAGDGLPRWSRVARHRAARLLLAAAAPLAGGRRPFSRAATVFAYASDADRIGAAYMAARGVVAPRALARIVRPDLLEHAGAELDVLEYLDDGARQPVGPVVAESPRASHETLARAVSILDLRGPLMSGRLRDHDRAASCHGLVVRSPFLDHRLYEWLYAAPAPGRATSIFHAVVGAMPPRFTRRLGPHQPPLGSWIQSELRSFLEPHVLGDDADGLFVRSGLELLWKDALAGRADWQCLWSVATLRAWLAARRRRLARAPGRIGALAPKPVAA